jgi:hypothetical protein
VVDPTDEKDARRRFLGVSAEALDEARRAVDALMRRFEIDGGRRQFTLAYQTVTAWIRD